MRALQKKKRIALGRILEFGLKMILILAEVLLLLIVLFVMIVWIFSCMEEGRFINPVSEAEVLISRCQCKIGQTDVQTIFMTVFSALFSVVALYQTHYIRIQDRAEALPGKQLKEISVGLHNWGNFLNLKKYCRVENPATMIEFEYGERLSSFYKAYPYRLFISLQRNPIIKDKVWEEIKILDAFEVNLPRQNEEHYKLIIAGSESRLLNEYCSHGNREMILEIILDIKWQNSLVPVWSRNFANLYIRERLRLDNDSRLQNQRYAIEYSEHSRSFLAAFVLLLRCRHSERKERLNESRQKKSRKKLRKRNENT